jgi:pimeloyl-ACP methyl ester carboxylesterase
MTFLWIILSILILLLVAVGYFFSRLIIYPQVLPYEETYQHDVENGRLNEAEFQSWPKEEFMIRSPYGYDLYAMYLPNGQSQRTIVISHGITWSLYGSVKYAALFYKRGFNVLLYDLRNHGRSGGKNTSFGFYERKDLQAVVDAAFARLGPEGKVATLGESLGAATTLQHAGIDTRISFAIADCSFSNLRDLLAYRLKVEYHLPPFPFLALANLFTRLIGGWQFSQASPDHDIPEIHTPIFFIHGDADTYIPPEMSVGMYEKKCVGYRKLYLSPNAEHAGSLVTNPIEYDQQITAFLSDIGF